MNAVAGLKIDYFYLLVPIILWRCPLSAPPAPGQNDRKAGRSDKAADLVTVMAKVFPADTNVRYLQYMRWILDEWIPSIGAA